MMKNLRYVVYPKDLIHFTGRTDSYCRSLIRTIKKAEGLEKDTMVTYLEVAKHLRLPPELVLNAINNLD